MKSCLIPKAEIHTSTRRFLPGLLPRSRASPFTSAIFARNVGGRSMSSSSEPPTHRVFHLRLDPLTGNSELIVVNEEEVEAKNPNDANSLLAATSYLDMLNDSRRNRAFYQAIKKTITKPCHVLDIGAGTGLLSMMAAQALIECGGGEGSVSACEAYLPMGKLMRKVLRENGLEKKIRIFHKRSDELEVGIDLTSRADVLVSEILDSELLGEGLIPTLQHAHDLLLVENAQTVPHRATTYGQLVESTFLGKLNDLYSSEVIASDGVRLVPSGLERIVCTKSKHYAMDCNAIAKTTRLLSEPFKIFEFDFWKRPDSQGETELHLKATDDGTVHAVISWWVLQLDAQGSIYYSTAPNWINFINTHKVPAHIPGAKEWCDHWKQCVWFIPGIGMPVSKDQRVLFQATHNGTSISYCLRNDRQIKEVAFGGLGTGDCQLMLLPERIGIYGEKEWRSTWLTAAKYALQGKSSLLCVVADDSAFLTIAIARLSKSSHIISSFPGLREKGARYLQAIADANSFSMDNVKVLGKRTSCLTMDDLNQRKVDLLIGEPFYCGSEGILPWHNLRFWYERTSVDSILADDAIIMPCKGILKACAMSLPDLWRSRCCLKKIEGFDHSCVNETLGACGNLPPTHEGPCLPYFIWQCGDSKELSEVFSIMEFNFLDRIHQCSGKAKVGFTRPGVCHGFVLWIDWVIDERNSIAISTGPDRKYWKQGVKLLSKPVEVNLSGSCKAGECCSTEIEAFFDPSDGELDIKSSFTI